MKDYFMGLKRASKVKLILTYPFYIIVAGSLYSLYLAGEAAEKVGIAITGPYKEWVEE